ncbi:hypothetical protein Leryth_024150 [Lithospermum erythrorhizon]|nr:hypothetical protein Leryth_024150 [Lithospermum erythrorhizon]
MHRLEFNLLEQAGLFRDVVRYLSLFNFLAILKLSAFCSEYHHSVCTY